MRSEATDRANLTHRGARQLIVASLCALAVFACSQPTYEQLMQEGTQASKQEDFKTARARYTQAVALARKSGSDHKLQDEKLAEALYKLGGTKMRASDQDGAYRDFSEALDIKTRNEKQDDLASTLQLQLGEMELQRGDTEGAEKRFLKSLTVGQDSVNFPNAGTARAFFALASIHEAKGKLSQAEKEYKQGIDIYESKHLPDYSPLAVAYHSLANVLRQQEKNEEADEADARATKVDIGGIKDKVQSMPFTP